MDKFSSWRDPSTGLAPFVYPLPPLSTLQLPPWAPLPLYPLATLRTVVLVLLGCIFVVVERFTSAFLVRASPSVHLQLCSWYTTVFGRVALYLLGFTRLPSEVPFTTRTAALKLIRPQIRPGDLIVANWSSYVEIIYLAYLYNPIFILPSPEHPPRPNAEPVIRGFSKKGVLELVFSSGYPPGPDPLTDVHSLAEWTVRSKRLMRPLVVLPEATTSNNRALLKFVKLTPESVGKSDGIVKVYCLIFKHEPPTTFKNSITIPIPSRPLNLPHILRSNLVPILLAGVACRSLTIRYPRTTNHPLMMDTLDCGCLDVCAELIGSVGKLKQTSQVGWTDKDGFLKYLKTRR